MAKRRTHKGKAKRRVNWQSHYQAGNDMDAIAASRGKLSHRGIKLGDGAAAAAEATPDPDAQQISGMVTGIFRRGVWVRVEGEELFCGIAKTFRPPEDTENTSPLAVGDAVTLALPNEKHVDGQVHLDRNRMDGMILFRERRRTLLSRPEPRSEKRREDWEEGYYEKVLAANMDMLLIVAATASPAVHPGLIDRFLIAAQRGELQPVVVFNKLDLAPVPEGMLADLTARGIEVVCCCAEDSRGLPELAAKLVGKQSVLAGASGVGKSTLLNLLVPEAMAATREIRAKDNRGRHTTSQARVYDIAGGGLIVDTPGIRELAVPLEPERLQWYFPEFEPFINNCKFRNCTHTHEPGCAIQRAVEEGELPADRYESYLRILDTLD